MKKLNTAPLFREASLNWDFYMFKKKTVFILGAGASCPYQYPLGQTLVDEIIDAIEDDEIYFPVFRENSLLQIAGLQQLYETLPCPNYDFEHVLHSAALDPLPIQTGGHSGTKKLIVYNSGQEIAVCEKMKLKDITKFQFAQLADRLKKSPPVSIDSFLRDNLDLREVGRTMIIYCLLKKETENVFIRQNPQYSNDDWYPYFIEMLMSETNDEEAILKNLENLHIVTFNYDMSLPYYILSRLSAKTTHKNAYEILANKLIEQGITHVYGKLYDANDLKKYGNYYQSKSTPKSLQGNLARLLRAFHLKDNIKLIQDRTDAADTVSHIKAADEVFIIGFGFNEENMGRLEMPASLKKQNNKIFLFNYKGEKKNLIYRARLQSGLKGTVNWPNTILLSEKDKISKALSEDFIILE